MFSSQENVTSFSVKLWYNKQRIKKSGCVSLYLQICCGSETSEVPLKLEWLASHFDWNSRALISRGNQDKDFLEFNILIESERSKYWEVCKKLRLEKGEFLITDVFERVNTHSDGLADYMLHTITKRVRNRKLKESTARSQKLSAQWVVRYRPKGVSIMHIDCSWLEKFEDYLLSFMHPNTVWARIKDVKTYLNYAFKKDKIPVNHDFERFPNPKPISEPVWLEDDELWRLINLYKCSTHPGDKRDLRAFLFACFTGLRISDLKRFRKEWIQGDEFIFEPQKQQITKTRKKTLRIPLIPIAREFVDGLGTSSLVTISDTKLNENLKRLAAKAGISKNLTTHVARHTFATQLAIHGVPVVVIMQLMGHSKIEVTMIYIHIAEKVRTREMMKLQVAYQAPVELPA